MDYKKLIEKWLKEYNDLTYKITVDETMLYELEHIGSGVDCSREAIGKTNKFNSEVENTAIAIADTKERIKANTRKIKVIDEAMNKIGYSEKRILELRYFSGKKWNYICEKMNYEYSWCQELKLKGIKQMSKIMFG